MNAENRIRKNVEKWFITEPLMFGVWMLHTLVENNNIQNIRTGKGKIEYNADFINALDKDTLETVLLLEGMRILLKHPYSRKKEIASAAYLASNITLQEYLSTPLPIPKAKDIFHTEELDKQYFECYYERLLVSNIPIGGLYADAGGDGSESPTTSFQSPSEGSDFSGEVKDYLNPAESGLENTQAWDRDEFEVAMINDKIRSAQQNDSWGNIAGRWREMILATLVPKINYRKMLRAFRASILSQRRVLTRMKPSRRYGFDYMGSKYDFSTRLLFAVDVSGSIGSDDLEYGYSVINQLFKYGIESVDVIQFDTEIKGEAQTFKKAKKHISIEGRGGTDFDDVMGYIETRREYDGLVVFTDGYANSPRKPNNKKTKIFWLFNTESNYNRMAGNVTHTGRAAFIKER
jgi:predicted metal-dependent peptidase